MAYEKVVRTIYLTSAYNNPHSSKNHYEDFQDFHNPLVRMHNSNLHDWGIAHGLEVNGAVGETKIIINPGVAIDINGQLISLSSDGWGANDPNYPTNDSLKVITPIPLSTESFKGQQKTSCYVTIQHSEIETKRNSEPGLALQVPWVRLQRIVDYEKPPVAAVRQQATLVTASNDRATVTSAEDAAEFKKDDIVYLEQGTTNETALIYDVNGITIKFNKNLTEKYTGGIIRIADLVPQQKNIRLADTTYIKKDTYINIVQNNVKELKKVHSVDPANNFIELNQGLVNSYTMAVNDASVEIQAIDNSIVLAIAVIDEDGKLAQLATNPAELKNVTNLPLYRRRLIGESIEELRIQRSSNVKGKIQDLLSGKIGPGDAGGLKITVPDAQDNILFARQDGGSFSSLGINANVGIGTSEPKTALDVSKTDADTVIRAQTVTSGNSTLSLLNNGDKEYQIVANRMSNRLEITSPETVGVMMAFDPNNGNVGIGASAPENAEGWAKVLDILGSGTTKLSVRTPNIDARVLSHDNGWWGAPAGMIIGTNSAHPLSFGTNATSRMIIDEYGNVSINGNLRTGNLSTNKLAVDEVNNLTMGVDSIHFSDTSYGIGWYHVDKIPFGNTEEFSYMGEGLVVFSRAYGALGTTGDGQKIALRWDSFGNVEIKGNLSADNLSAGKIETGRHLLRGYLHTDGNPIYLRKNTNDLAHGIGWYDAFAGTPVDGPVAFGFSGGALGTTCGGQKIVLKWDSAGNVGIGTPIPQTKLDVQGDIRISGHIIQDDWISPQLLPPWIIYGDNQDGGGYNVPGYFLDKNGIVHLKGLLIANGHGDYTTIFILRDGYRPARQELHTVNASNNFARCDICADGSVFATLVKPGQWFSLDGITFRADH